MRLFLAGIVLSLLITGTLWAAADPLQTVRDARVVILELVSIPEQGIPPSLLNRAHALAIIPNLIKAGLIIGGRYGEGIILVRGEHGEWGPPVFVKLLGGSLGWQIGAQESDVVLVFKSAKSVEGIFQGKFTLGADAGVAAGPAGRRVEGTTDLEFKAEIYSYSRSRGLFAGVSLEGASLLLDDEANDSYYQSPGITPRMILDGEGGQQPLAGKRLLMELQGVMINLGETDPPR